MPDTPAQINGHRAAAGADAAKQAEEFCYVNYGSIAGQLGAINTLLCGLPLDALLAACRRQQATVAITAPAGVTAQQVAAASRSLINDERIIIAALKLQRTLAAVNSGRG